MAPVHGDVLKNHAREICLLVIISEQKLQLPCSYLSVQIPSPLTENLAPNVFQNSDATQFYKGNNVV